MNICWHNGYTKTYLMELFIHTHVDKGYAFGLRGSCRRDCKCEFGFRKIIFCSPQFPLNTLRIIFSYSINDTFKMFHFLPFCVDVMPPFHETCIYLLLPNFLSLLAGLLQIHSDTNLFTFSTIMSA